MRPDFLQMRGNSSFCELELVFSFQAGKGGVKEAGNVKDFGNVK